MGSISPIRSVRQGWLHSCERHVLYIIFIVLSQDNKGLSAETALVVEEAPRNQSVASDEKAPAKEDSDSSAAQEEDVLPPFMVSAPPYVPSEAPLDKMKVDLYFGFS